jgi:hypothetical protein
MQTFTIRQRAIRLAGMTALAMGLALSTGVAAAMPSPAGLTECEHAGCAIVTSKAAAKRFLADYDPPQSGGAGGPLRPHLVP